jgi:uncharacterized oxidoreductase
MEIAGKTALVTGGTDGIGLEIARLLKAKGADVIVCGRRADCLAAAQAEGLEAIEADLSSASGVKAFADIVSARGLDIIINNAGVSSDFTLDVNTDLASVDRAIFLNLNAPIHLAALLIPGLKTRPSATLVNVTSGLAIAPRAGGSVYCATKAGLRSFTKAIRYLLKDSNIIVIEALPPVVETAMTATRTGRKMSPQACAAEIVAAIVSGKEEANVGMVKMLKTVHSLSPRLAEAIMIKF